MTFPWTVRFGAGRFIFCVTVFFLLSLTGCRDDEQPMPVVYENTAENKSEVLALIGDREVTRADVETMLKGIPERRRQLLKERVLDDVIELKVLAKEARKKGLDREPEIRTVLEKARKEVLAKSFVKMHLDREAEPSEERMREFYTAHKDQFLMPESVLVQQIVLRDKEKADAVLAQLKEGASFKELADTESIYGKKQGLPYQTWLYKGKIDPDLETVIFGLETNVLSDVVKSKKGYHIFNVLEKEEPGHVTFEQARKKIHNRFFWDNKEKILDRYYEAAGVDRNPKEPGVLARVGEEQLTEASLHDILSKMPEGRRGEVKRRWIDYFIETTVFSKEAEKAGLEKDPEVKRSLDIREDRILADAFRERYILDGTKVSEDAVARYYADHEDEFMEPEKVRLKGIMVKTKKEAEDILKEIQEKDLAFGYVAQEKSLYPQAKKRAGEMGWIPKGALPPALEEAGFALEKNAMSDVIETKEGFFILKLMDRKGGIPKSLEDAHKTIEMKLMSQRYEEEKKKYYEKAGVQIIKPYE